MTKTSNLAYAVRPMPLERVHFFDGMILSADDLEAEREYHLARSRMVNRAVFGCGIACGLEVKKHPEGDEATRFVCVQPGTAFDCRGDPLELCRSVKLDLDPDPCKPPPACVCILIRRRDGDPKAGDPCDCGEAGTDGPRRVREEVEIRVVDCTAALEGVCRIKPEETTTQDAGDCKDDEKPREPEEDLCDCLTTCESCDPCGEGWILLACVKLKNPGDDDSCTGSDRDRWVIDGEVDGSGRKYIKPIRCHCLLKKPETPEDPQGYPGGSEVRKQGGKQRYSTGQANEVRKDEGYQSTQRAEVDPKQTSR